MKKTIHTITPLSVLVAAALVCAPADAAPAKPKAPLASASPCDQVTMGPAIRLAVGKSTLLKLQTPISRILLGNPADSQASRPTEGAQAQNAGAAGAANQQNTRRPGVADIDVVLLSPREIYLLGKAVGSTNIAMLDRAGQCTVIDVVVGIDTVGLSASLKELLPGENKIKISSAGDSIVLTGTVHDAVAADQVVDIAQAYVRRISTGAAGSRASANDSVINMLAVDAPQQVMLEVKVAEVSKALLDQFGINFARAYASADGSTMRFLSGILGGKGAVAGQVSGATGALVGGGQAAGQFAGSGAGAVLAPSGSATFTNGVPTQWSQIAGKNATGLSVDAQKQDGLLKVLAEPTVMAISGQEGSFLAGGKIFLPVATNNGSGGTSITLEEKEFGVSLKFTPTVLADGRINLKVAPEVSEINSQGVAITATNVAGTAILPSFTTRRATTTVQLMDGQSFAIGGLIKNNVTANVTAFPWLGEIPVLGALFRSTSFQSDRTELVFVITPRLVKPLPPDYALPTDKFEPPSRTDMILRGRLEGSSRDKDSTDASTSNASPASQGSGGFEVK